MSTLAYLWLIRPARISSRLEDLRQSKLFLDVPNEWQLGLGVLRMLHRILFRSHTIGTSSGPIRSTPRARLLAFRSIRLPFLLWERAVAPLDLSGLLMSKERMFCHLLGAHHDHHQFVYDLEILEAWPGALRELRDRAAAVVEERSPRAVWLKDLVVFEGYHEALLSAVDSALAGHLQVDDAERDNPDITFRAYLAWCCRQPSTPRETLRTWLSRKFLSARPA